MNRVLIIDDCDECKYFDNEYYTYLQECTILDRKIPGVEYIHAIPDDCPLQKTGEDATEI